MDNTGSLKVKLLFLTSAFILILIAAGLFSSWQKNKQINSEIGDLELNIQELRKDNLELHELVEYFNSDAYVEEKARIDLGLKKPEEKVVIVTEQREQGITLKVQQDSRANAQSLSNPQKWWQYFFN